MIEWRRVSEGLPTVELPTEPGTFRSLQILVKYAGIDVVSIGNFMLYHDGRAAFTDHAAQWGGDSGMEPFSHWAYVDLPTE